MTQKAGDRLGLGVMSINQEMAENGLSDAEQAAIDAKILAGRANRKFVGFTSDEAAFAGDVLDTFKKWWFAALDTREEKRQRDKLLGYVEAAVKIFAEN